MSDYKKCPKRFNAINPLNAKSRSTKNTNCTKCSNQRTQYKHQCAKKERRRMEYEINDVDFRYRDSKFESKFQSLRVMNESDEAFRKRFFKGSRPAILGRNVF